MGDQGAGRGAGRALGPPREGDAPAQAGTDEGQGAQLPVVGGGEGLGDDGDAEAPPGELGEHARVAGLEGDARPEARRGAGVVDDGSQARAPGQADERPLPQGV